MANCSPRLAEVDRLIRVAGDALMAEAGDSSAAEIVSALFTMASRAMSSAMELGWDPESLRPGVLVLWAKLPPVKVDG